MASVVDVYYVKKNLEKCWITCVQRLLGCLQGAGLQWLLSDSVARKY